MKQQMHWTSLDNSSGNGFQALHCTSRLTSGALRGDARIVPYVCVVPSTVFVTLQVVGVVYGTWIHVEEMRCLRHLRLLGKPTIHGNPIVREGESWNVVG